MSIVVKTGKKVKAALRKTILLPPSPTISYTRRIERVATRERVCAMTFDDGPMNMPANPDNFGGRALTDVILDTLKEFGAHGTFDVIGYTGGNYPDTAGKLGTAQWGGIAYDHYPDIHADEFGGAVRCGELIRRIIAEGHQITNHGYTHRLFGKKAVIYGKRRYLQGLDEVIADLKKLDKYLVSEYGYKMTMSRPPHYVDGIRGGFTSYDAYGLMDYQYMAASYDGAGWLPCHSGQSEQDFYRAEVAAMVEPMRELLESDPDAFCGQIIFQKDGCNMDRRTPVAEGLRGQLELLAEYGYKVVTVERLMEYSPFADVGSDDPDFECFARLAGSRAIVYSNNTLQPDRPMTRGELAMLMSPRSAVIQGRIDMVRRGASVCADVDARHKYSGAVKYCLDRNLLGLKNGKFLPAAPVERVDIETLPDLFDGLDGSPVTRRTVLRAFRAV